MGAKNHTTKASLKKFFHIVRFEKTNRQKEECLACTESMYQKDLVQIPECKHKYCRKCFNTLIQTNTRSEHTFPPRCCESQISKLLVAKHASKASIKQYNKIQELVDIPTEHRWFCPNPKCESAFDVRLAVVAKKGVKCTTCRKTVCVACKGRAHRDPTKCNDDGLKQAMEVSKKNQWQACPRCQNIIAHNGGCRHMTCLCGASFCYVCGRRWKHCKDNNVCSNRLYEATQRENAARERELRQREQELREARETTEDHESPAAFIQAHTHEDRLLESVFRAQRDEFERFLQQTLEEVDATLPDFEERLAQAGYGIFRGRLVPLPCNRRNGIVGPQSGFGWRGR